MSYPFNTRGSGFDTLLGIYTGTNVVSLTEVMVDGERTHLIRARESVQQLYALEQILP